MIFHLYWSSCKMQFTSLEMYWLLVDWIVLFDWVQRSVERPVISNNADELEIVLAKASMPNKTLIMTVANRAWMEPNGLIDLLLESFRIGEETQGLLDYLLIVALDEKAFNRCKEIHPHCYDLRTEGVDFSGEKVFMTEDYLKITRRKIDFLKDVVQHGFSFVFTVSLPAFSKCWQ